MRNACLTALLLALVVACSRARPTAEFAPICSAADRSLVNELQRTMHDSARIAPLERALADTARTNALSRVLADTVRRMNLRRLPADSAWGAQQQPRVDALLAELARFASCTR